MNPPNAPQGFGSGKAVCLFLMSNRPFFNCEAAFRLEMELNMDDKHCLVFQNSCQKCKNTYKENLFFWLMRICPRNCMFYTRCINILDLPYRHLTDSVEISVRGQMLCVCAYVGSKTLNIQSKYGLIACQLFSTVKRREGNFQCSSF